MIIALFGPFVKSQNEQFGDFGMYLFMHGINWRTLATEGRLHAVVTFTTTGK